MIVTGVSLFASALHGVAGMDTSLQIAASRAAPDRALVQESERQRDCPYGERREPV